MKANVYNIVWADDEIDDILDSATVSELEDMGYKIVGRAHDGVELESLLKKPEMVDAVIVDANFNESDVEMINERDTSGLEYARGLYLHKLDKRIPFFLFTNHSDELLKNIYQSNLKFLEDFPRHKRWFHKSGQGEYHEMLSEIKNAVDEMKSTSFIVRNRYQLELEAADIIDKDTDEAKEFIFNFLVHDFNDSLTEVKEPFVSVRRTVEKIFKECEILNIIPPISDNMNGTVCYFLRNEYSIKDSTSDKYIPIYKMIEVDIMPKALATALKYIVDITQDGAHSKKKLRLNVNKYFEESKDVLLLRSVVYVLIDILVWFSKIKSSYPDSQVNMQKLWRKIDDSENTDISVV